jgi:hypothetical protein
MSPASALSYLAKPDAVLSSPPSIVIEQAFKSGLDVNLENLAREVLLPVNEVEMWIKHLAAVSENRKRGVAKAVATKKSKFNGRQRQEEKIVRCGVCSVIYEEETEEVERWIACDLCTTWFHWECVNVTTEPESFVCTLCG